MATSGSTDFTVSRNDVITEALELVGALGEGESPNPDQITSCARTLNMMMKAWQSKGINLFAVDIWKMFLVKEKARYKMPATSNVNNVRVCRAVDFSGPTLTADAALGAPIVYLTVGALISGDHIGIELDDGTMHWTTIAAIGTDWVGINDILPSAASENNKVYSYTTNLGRPMKILEAYLSSTNDTEIDIVSRSTYSSLPTKQSTGEINQIYYEPLHTAAYLHVWPTPDNNTDYLTLNVVRTLEDVDADDDVDYPQEWYLALAYNLAKYISPKYGVPSPTKRDIVGLAMELYMDAEDWDVEYPTSIYMQPDEK